MNLRRKKQGKIILHNIIRTCCLTGALFAYGACGYAALSNDFTPAGGQWIKGGEGSLIGKDGILNVVQKQQNAVIQWGDFSIGANATVNFSKEHGGSFNVLNYVDSGNVSQIYGTINAKDGNVFLVNTAGTIIGKSAQINVGSLYVSNKKLVNISSFDGSNISKLTASDQPATGAELMSLGNIMANKITFDGNRIVLDTERVETYAGNKLQPENIVIKTTNEADVVLGYAAYDEQHGYAGKNDGTALATVNVKGTSKKLTKKDGYMWIKDAVQLQAVDTNLSGKYALHNSIDATATDKWNGGKGFKPIGVDGRGEAKANGAKYGFTGILDGLDNAVFGLTINRADVNNVGLFGVAQDAAVKNITLVGGSIKGSSNVGSVIGTAVGGTTVSNMLNSTGVSGKKNIGGIIGFTGDFTADNKIITANGVFKDLVNTGIINSSGGVYDATDKNAASNVGGLIGFFEKGSLTGDSYNMGSVTGTLHNVGGLVGYAVGSTIGNKDSKEGILNNQLNVIGKYNVGGIVGLAEDVIVQNVSNAGNVKAIGTVKDEYKYHTDYRKHGEVTLSVDAANVGGIAGNANDAVISGVLNTGDISSSKAADHDYYDAGNVGGVVGKAINTNIMDALNKESDIRGAHNVGGIAGYFGNRDGAQGRFEINGAVNSGGDILATGARLDGQAVTERVRGGSSGDEEVNFGNMGGIAGYMDGDNTYITNSGNRGTVHSLELSEEQKKKSAISQASKAANTGGIVGKIDRSSTKAMDIIKDNYKEAAVSNSYNTGDVRGYLGVGGVIGMMYNGEAAGVYNLGNINTTRETGDAAGKYYSVNMGGVVGDATEETSAHTNIYDVYNKGRIGDPNFRFKARHVGGIAGRLTGNIEKSYNNGDIYNGYSVVGGIVGWMYAGTINNSFNTGNITVEDNDKSSAGSQVGGIAGAVNGNKQIDITNVYNMGVLRCFLKESNNGSMGGLLGMVNGDSGHVKIENAYTTGHLYMEDAKGNSGENWIFRLGSIYGVKGKAVHELKNVFYIKPAANSGFTTITGKKQQASKAIDFDKRYDRTQYEGLSFSADNGSSSGKVSRDGQWRIYDGTGMPILNAFLPDSESYFAEEGNRDGINKLQYGTAYNPLLTIIDANRDLTYDWDKLGAKDNTSFAVYGGGLTINNFCSNKGEGYYAGLLYADGDLKVNGKAGANIDLGSVSELYGSSINITTDSKLTAYGWITSTGNKSDQGASADKAGVTIIAGKGVDIYGDITSAVKGQSTVVEDINNSQNVVFEADDLSNRYQPVTKIGRRFAHKTDKASVSGSINITATDGDVNIYFGNMESGLISSGNDINLIAQNGNVFVDSDLNAKGNLVLSAKKEALLDLSNIGRVEARFIVDVIESAVRGETITEITDDLVKTIAKRIDAEPDYKDKFSEADVRYILRIFMKNDGSLKAVEDTITLRGLHDFINSLDKNKADSSSLSLNADNTKLTVDLWNDEAKSFDLSKYDFQPVDADVPNSFRDNLSNIKLKVNDKLVDNAFDYACIEISGVDQLDAISKMEGSGLEYNYAVMENIDASNHKDFVGVAAADGQEYKGKFDGRGNGIIGLTAKKGLFGTVGAAGEVKNLNIYSGNFSSGETTSIKGLAGAVAAENKGFIDNVTGFGNTVSGSLAVGGLVGFNSGTLSNVHNIGIASADSGEASVGGLVGVNEYKKDSKEIGRIENAVSLGAVVSTGAVTGGLGGVAGYNQGVIHNADSEGVTRGQREYINEGKVYVDFASNDVGGIAGKNSGLITEAYNEGILMGADYVGGITGSNSGIMINVSNAANIAATGEDKDRFTEYAGGLTGSNSGSITNGRNNGCIEGYKFVGGLVGYNAAGSVISNLVNDSSATIIGEEYVGGIAGSNAGQITANQQLLVNRGSIVGQKYVGGAVGYNTGLIYNTNNNVRLQVKDKNRDAMYFGGVAGHNDKAGTIGNATNRADVAAENAQFVGGVAGKNDGILKDFSGNYGNVTGSTNVGGVVGQNNVDISNIDAVNEGSVTALKGGAGGIFGEHSGKIIDSRLNNRGTVIGTGNDGTGGIANTNSGEIKNSILSNEGMVYNAAGIYVGGIFGNKTGAAVIDSKLFNNGLVVGKEYVGGIFGKNTSDITETTLANNMNGHVIGSSNVGGLIGVNGGAITGGRDKSDSYYKHQIYNNGNIIGAEAQSTAPADAAGWKSVEQKAADGTIHRIWYKQNPQSTNIGGLAGQNSGTITAAYNTGKVAGNANVGGIAGTNTGTIRQVFNSVFEAGLISGSVNVGAIVGDNDSGTVEDAYTTTAVQGGSSATALIGRGNGVSSNEANWRKYGTGSEEGYSRLLSVFLTKLEFTPNADFKNIAYNAHEQGFEIKHDGNAYNVYLKGVEGKADVLVGTLSTLSSDIDAAHSLEDYLRANQLLTTGKGRDSGSYQLFSTQQISSNAENHNNLGYDIVGFENLFEIKKATIDVFLNEISRTYGDAAIKTSAYGHSYSDNVNKTMAEELKALIISNRSDGALTGSAKGRVTKDAGTDYEWSETITIGADLAKNYQFAADGATSVERAGKSIVNKAQLTIKADNVDVQLGDRPKYMGSISGIVNGDTESSLGIGGFGISDKALESIVGTHNGKIGIRIGNTLYYLGKMPNEDTLLNYDIALQAGTLKVSEPVIPPIEPPVDPPAIVPPAEQEQPNISDKAFWEAEDKYAWGRKAAKRERKAEIHYVDGGMKL